ncbi:MAG: hypothetical protein WDN28_03925 [Chthoniobacter sp.]
MPLPQFSVDLQVSEETGREDKIEIDLGRWILSGSPRILDQVRSFISSPPEEMRPRLNPGDPHPYGWIFARPSNPGIRREHLRVRKRAIEGREGQIIAERLLFAGKWKLAYRKNTPDRIFPTYLALSLNPLRYLRYQPIPNPLPRPNATDWPRAELFFPHASDVRQNGGEFSLDGEDNWLCDTSSLSEWSNPTRWYRHVDTYIQGVVDTFNAELERVTTPRQVGVEHENDFIIRKVETIWEFRADEPTEVVASLVPHLTAYRASSAEMQEFPVRLPTREVNSISLLMKLSRNTSLRVYAKTNRRIRFEVIQEQINHRELLNEPIRPRGASAERRIRPWEQIQIALSVLRARAANELNAVLRHLAQRMRTEPSHLSGFAFMMRIGAILQNEDLALTVVSLLVHHQLIEPRNAPQLQSACSLLREHGVLPTTIRLASGG